MPVTPRARDAHDSVRALLNVQALDIIGIKSEVGSVMHKKCNEIQRNRD